MRGSNKAAKQLCSLFAKPSSKKKLLSKASRNLTARLNTPSSVKGNEELSVSLRSSLLDRPSRGSEEAEHGLFNALSNILGGDSSTVLGLSNLPASEVSYDKNSSETVLDVPWFPNMSNTSMSHHKKEMSRVRKGKWVFKNTQSRRFERLVNMCGDKLGAKTALEVFGKLGRESGVKDYNAFVARCVQDARTSQDDEDSLVQIQNAYLLIREMNEQGFQVDEKTFGSLLSYLIDMEMVEEFHFFLELIKNGSQTLNPRLGYYEMLLWIRVDNEDKVQELCKSIVIDADGDGFQLAENYLLALCEADRKKELLQLLEVVDITEVSSRDYVSNIFKSSGRLLMEEFAENLILALKASKAAEDVSYFITNYAISMPNLAVEDVVIKFEDMHKKLDVIPASKSYEMLIIYGCDSLEVHAALAIIDQMCQLGLTLSFSAVSPILHAIEESCEFDLVHPIYSVIRRHNLKPNGEAFRILIQLFVKMKDFEGAYNMLNDLKEMNMKPTTYMYNAILGGHFREKNFRAAELVLAQMKGADVKPDCQTFSYLISNSEREQDIVKYYKEMQAAKVPATKRIYMALINAYVNCGQFEKAKQVVLDKGLPAKSMNEVKSVCVSALASCGQMSDALELYEEIKQAGCHLEPKAVISLIEHLQSVGDLNTLLELLKELKDPDFWFDGCERVVGYCIQHKHISSAIDLLKQLKDQDEMLTYAVLDQVFCRIYEIEPIDLQIGLDLLQVVKEELMLFPSRTSLDFLLSACVSARDPRCGRLVREEYLKAGLAFNVLTYLRIYQLHLACGEYKDAEKVMGKMPLSDPHVRTIVKACELTYGNKSKKKKKKKKASRPNRQ